MSLAEVPRHERIPVRFVVPPPGFESARTAELEPLDPGDDTFLVMSFAEHPVEFLVTRPELFFSDYSPRLERDVVRKINLRRDDRAALYAIVNVNDGPATATANLLAPVVVNKRTGEAVQAVLNDTRYSLRALLMSGVSTC